MATVTVSIPSAKSWKTTLAGALAALGAYFSTLDGYYTIAGQILTVGGLFLMGLVSKDSNVTGGTVVQDSSAAAKAAVTVSPTSTAP
jgi:hypothetical protein